jgi:hypothetical protein
MEYDDNPICDDILRALFDDNIDKLKQCDLKSYVDQRLIHVGIAYRSADCLCFLHESGYELPPDIIDYMITWIRTTTINIQYLHEHGFQGFDIFHIKKLIEKNDLDSIIYLHQQGYSIHDSMLTDTANRYDRIKCLQYLVENGCPWDSNLLTNAIFFGRFDILKFAHEHGCPPPTYPLIIGNGCVTKHDSMARHTIGPNMQKCLDYVTAHQILILQEIPSNQIST